MPMYRHAFALSGMLFGFALLSLPAASDQARQGEPLLWPASAARPAFGWQDFDDEFGTLLWLPAPDDDRPFLPMVWTCLGDWVEVSFPRTDDDPEREPWQMFLRVGGQDFVSEVTVHDYGLTAEFMVASGLFDALQGARELVIAPDRDEQVVLPAQTGDLEARDGFFAWCLVSEGRPHDTAP